MDRRRWGEILAAFVALFVIAIAVAVWNNQRIDRAERRIRITQQMTAKLTFESRLHAERVCSNSNRGQACRDLFQRLAEDISPTQRRELACTVAAILALPEYETVCK